MKACITAGSHPNLIDPIGKIHGHPDKKGLVLELIPPTFTNLGLPPTLDTCTRDSFPPGTIFSAKKCLNILRSIASAAAHLHDKGISHGDLYAHNTLIDGEGHALLGDFGAATIYRANHANAKDIERLEVLAFGHLIEDVSSLIDVDADENSDHDLDLMRTMHDLATKSAPRERPSFSFLRDNLVIDYN
jgi:serine/threonine protein kinase